MFIYIFLYKVYIYTYIQNMYTTCHAFDTSTWSPDPNSEEAEDETRSLRRDVVFCGLTGFNWVYCNFFFDMYIYI